MNMISSILNNFDNPDYNSTTVEKLATGDRKVKKHNLQAITKKHEIGDIQYLLNPSAGPFKSASSVKATSFNSNTHFSIQDILLTKNSNSMSINNNTNDSIDENKSYRGLKNLGATCYMNSFLQVLFHLPLFRRYIFKIDVGDTNQNHNILLHLQRIFAMMQLSDYSVSTKDLAKSFGWSNIETMMQQDIYEFCSVFLEKIDVAIQKIPQNKKISISSLFRGKYLSTIRCRHVNFQTQTTNVINVCTLDVRGVSSLDESFMNFTAMEPLDGSNQYDTGSVYGLQDADMFSQFIELPPVLMLHLKRFDINMETQQNSKIDTFFSFTKDIDLRSYLADQNSIECSQYQLFGVLVHAGTIHSGHYTAYLRPTPESMWYYFNDSEVRVVDEDKAISDNFGGPDPFQSKKNKSHCAYMLIYVRVDSISTIFLPILNEEVPGNFKQFVIDNDQQIKVKKKIKEDENQRVKAYIIQVQDLEYLAERTGRILFDSSLIIEIKKSMTFDDIYDLVAVLLDTHPLYLTIWIVQENSLKSKLDRNSGKVDDIMKFSFDTNNIKLFVEIYEVESPNRSLSPHKTHSNPNILTKTSSFSNQHTEILIFLYSYFPSQKRPFKFTSTVSIRLNESVSALFDSVRESFDIPSDVNMYSYIFIHETNTRAGSKSPNLLFITNPERTIGSLSLFDGSVIIIQPDPYEFSPGEKLNQHLETTSTGAKVDKEDQAYSFMPDFVQSPPLDITTYFNFLYNNRYITVNTLIDPDAHVYLRFPELITISLFKQFIADAFSISYNEKKDVMLIYWNNSTEPMIPCINKSNINPIIKVSDLLNNPEYENGSKVDQTPAFVDEKTTKINSILTSDVCEIMIHVVKGTTFHKISHIRRIICYTVTVDGFRSTSFVLINENATISYLLGMIKKSSPEFKMYPDIRIFQCIKGQGISMPLPGKMMISEIQNPVRIEVTPRDQVNLNLWSFLMQAYQVKPGSTKPIDFFSPFLILVTKDDTFASVKQRMKKFLKQRKIKDKKSRYFIKIEDHVTYLTDDFPMNSLVNVNSPIYIEEVQKCSGSNDRNGVRIYT